MSDEPESGTPEAILSAGDATVQIPVASPTSAGGPGVADPLPHVCPECVALRAEVERLTAERDALVTQLREAEQERDVAWGAAGLANAAVSRDRSKDRALRTERKARRDAEARVAALTEALNAVDENGVPLIVAAHLHRIAGAWYHPVRETVTSGRSNPPVGAVPVYSVRFRGDWSPGLSPVARAVLGEQTP